MELYDVLHLVRRNPDSFLHDGRSLTSLYAFLMGYELGLTSMGKKGSIFGEMRDFSIWLVKELGFSGGTRGWCTAILSKTESETEAFDRFFELFEKFRKEKFN